MTKPTGSHLPARPPAVRVLSRAVAHDARGSRDARHAASFTSLCVLANGTVLCIFQVGSTKHARDATLRISRSRDGGRSWATLPTQFQTVFDGIPGSLAAGEIVETSTGHLFLIATWFDRSDGGATVFNAELEAVRPSRQLRAYSSDEGSTWSAWSELRLPHPGCAITGPLLRWADGMIGFAYESYRDTRDPRPDVHHAAWLAVSCDDGATFGPSLLVAEHPQHHLYYWDQRLCESRHGHGFTALFWTHDLVRKKDLNVHRLTAAAGDRASRPVDSLIPGQIAAPLELADGRLIAAVVDRGDHCAVRLYLLDTQDGVPIQLLEVYRHDESAQLTQAASAIDFRKYWSDMQRWSFGHPALRQLPSGEVLLAYYAGEPNAMSIHCVCLELLEPTVPGGQRSL
jgi:hypothetical protein